jgi:hypothetical protein
LRGFSTLSITTLSIATLDTVMMNAIMLNVTNKLVSPSVVMLSVVAPLTRIKRFMKLTKGDILIKPKTFFNDLVAEIGMFLMLN